MTVAKFSIENITKLRKWKRVRENRPSYPTVSDTHTCHSLMMTSNVFSFSFLSLQLFFMYTVRRFVGLRSVKLRVSKVPLRHNMGIFLIYAPPHTSRFKKNVEVEIVVDLEWPSYSPELNPIEKLE